MPKLTAEVSLTFVLWQLEQLADHFSDLADDEDDPVYPSQSQGSAYLPPPNSDMYVPVHGARISASIFSLTDVLAIIFET